MMKISVKIIRIFGLGTILLGLTQGGSAWVRAQSIQDSNERQLLSELHKGNIQEIAIGKLAQKKGQNQAVKDYGTRLVEDHTRLDAQVRELAKMDGIRLMPPPSVGNKELSELRSLEGSEFDHKFKQLMIMDHEKDVAEVKKIAERIKNKSAQKTVMNDILPVLEKHEQLAKELLRKET